MWLALVSRGCIGRNPICIATIVVIVLCFPDLAVMRFVLATLAQAMEQLTDGLAELAHTVDSQEMTNVTCDLHRGRKA